MEKIPSEESNRESGISKIIGLESEQEDEMHERYKKFFEHPLPNDAERPKTEEEKRMITEVLEKLPDFIRKYGGNPIIHTTSENVHIFERDKLTDELKSFFDNNNGGYSTQSQYLFVVDRGDPVRNLETICHELIHLNSFQSIWFKNAPEKKSWDEWYDMRRIGFEIHLKDNGDTVFFRDINEAITEELTKRFDAESFERIEDISNDVEKRNFMKKISPTMFDMTTYSYRNERNRLNKIISDIYEKSKDEFQSPEDVFAIFANAAMSGKLLPIARLIEKTYGKGAFRKFGEETKTDLSHEG